MNRSRTLPIAESVSIPVDGVTLQGDLNVPVKAAGVVLFVHGSGSSRFSPRNRFVAESLNRAGLATLMFDLLTEEEERVDEVTGELRFDIQLLADRLVAVTDWLRKTAETNSMGVGYFGASTGAAAALLGAAARPEIIQAVVSRGGRPDLAGEALPNVAAPVLLIVGGDDDVVIGLNEQAMARLRVEKRLEIIPGATHLFAEPGALEEVARLAQEWFVRWVGGKPDQAKAANKGRR